MKVKVNEIELDLAPGVSAIDAVFAAGYDVPYFCSQEYMSPVGACRMCLARIGAPRKDRDTGEWILDDETNEPKIFWFPNMMATCTTTIMEGMVIDTLTERVVEAQNAMVEFTLINHPLDCPVCDKGGACELQDRAYEYGTGVTRFQFDKRHQEKHARLSDLITLDRERCIHCKRCVRYFEEVPGDEVLDFIERGGHTYIGTLEEGLPSNFSGNIADICPVGALLDSTARFKGRNWEYDHTVTTSLDDASGSSIVVDARTGRIERVKAGIAPDVNKIWIDDGTRFGHEYVDADDRIEEPLIRRDGQLVPTTWEEAVAFIVERLRSVGEKDIGIALRADATLEEGVGAKELAEHLGTGQVDHWPRFPASVIPAGPRATINELATAEAILVVGDVTEEVPVLDLRIKDAIKGVALPDLLPHGVPIADLRLKERAPRNRGRLMVAAPYRVELMEHAGTSAQYRAGGEREFFEALIGVARGEGTVDDAALGMPREAAETFVRRLREQDDAVVVLGSFVLASRAASEAAAAFAKSVNAKTMILGPMANSFGLELIGVTPSHDRYAYREMLAGGVKALIVSTLDPAADERAAELLRGLDLLVSHTCFHDATTAIAHVVLPAKTGYEKNGSTINLEGRLLPVSAAPVESGVAEDFTGLIKRLGEGLGTRLEGRSVRSARRVLKRTLDADFEALDANGLLLREAGRVKRRVTVEKDQTQEGDVLLVPSMARIEYLDRNPHLHAATTGVRLRLHPARAAELGVQRDDVVSLTVGGVRRRALVQPTEGVPPDLMLLPATPDQPPGLAQADVDSLVVERDALEVAV